MRYQEIKGVEGMCLDMLRETAMDMLSYDPDTILEKKIKTKDVDSLLFGLDIFKDAPKALEVSRSLKKWLENQSKYMAWSDFVDFSVLAAQNDTCNLDELSDLMRRCGNLKVDKTKFGDVFYVSIVLVTSLRVFITEAGSGWVALGLSLLASNITKTKTMTKSSFVLSLNLLLSL